MGSSFSSLPRLARVFVVVAAVGAIFFCGFIAGDYLHLCPNPAPLGRTDGEVTRTLSSALPNGVSLDSASAYLARAGVEFGVDRANLSLHVEHTTDSNLVGGPVVLAMERGVALSLFVSTDIQVRLYFDSAGRLARRDIRSVFTGP